jgi:hypothetical protein
MEELLKEEEESSPVKCSVTVVNPHTRGFGSAAHRVS